MEDLDRNGKKLKGNHESRNKHNNGFRIEEPQIVENDHHCQGEYNINCFITTLGQKED